MLHQAVSLHALGALAEEIGFLGLLAGAAHAAARIHHNVLTRDDARAQQRNERHEDARRVAAGRRHHARLLAPRGRRQLGQHEPRVRQQLGSMMPAVVLFVGREIRDAEIRAEVDHPLARGRERARVGRRRAVRQREEEKVDVTRGQRRRIGIRERKPAVRPAHRRDNRRERFTGLAAGSDRRECDSRMLEQKTDENFARVTGGADDADFHGRRNSRAKSGESRQI